MVYFVQNIQKRVLKHRACRARFIRGNGRLFQEAQSYVVHNAENNRLTPRSDEVGGQGEFESYSNSLPKS